LAEAVFGGAVDVRHFLYDAALIRAFRAPLTVVSVGGLTVGGSGKTPIAAELARWLLVEGHSVAVLTRGYADELAVHRELNPGAVVQGHPSRLKAACSAAEQGATVAVLDDGFQHLQLARDLDVLLVDLDALIRTNRHRLPAGPFRDRFREVSRAGAVVLVRRSEATSEEPAVAEWLARRLPDTPLAHCRLMPGALRPQNPAAWDVARPRPSVALTGVMKPNLFFDQLAERWPSVEHHLALPDHEAPTVGDMNELLERAGSQGIVTTLKDAVKLRGRVPDHVPLWSLTDRLEWTGGAGRLRSTLLSVAAQGPPDGPRGLDVRGLDRRGAR
jgi:tetraacyldisaccharide 4'-kinase